MTYQMMEHTIGVATDLCRFSIEADIDVIFIKNLALKQYIYEKETEGETD